MSTVNYVKLNSANVRVDNSQDEGRVYDMSADANIGSEGLNDLHNGLVSRKDEETGGDITVGNFSMYGTVFNITFFGIADLQQQMEIHQAVNGFVASARELASSINPVTTAL